MTREDPFEIDPAAETFYSRALVRISRVMLVLAVLLTIAALYFGYQKALGFAAGAAIAYLNFVWLKRAVVAMADRVVGAGAGSTSGAVVVKFVLRYLVAGLAALLLYRFVPGAMVGFLAGLFLPVAAILCEAAFEAYMALTHGT